MKQLLLPIAFLALFTFKVSAQNPKTTNDTAKRQACAGTNVIISSPLKTVLSKDIAKHIGEYVYVCDEVFTTRLIKESNITLLDLGGNYPNEILSIMIKGEDLSKFKEHPQVYYKGKNVCVFGNVIKYKGKQGIEVTSPYQVSFKGQY